LTTPSLLSRGTQILSSAIILGHPPKFYYSTASDIGIQVSPVYDVTIDQTLVTSLKLESEAKSS
jgi:hypothetical protein